MWMRLTVKQPVGFLFLVGQILSPLGHQDLQVFAVLLHLRGAGG